MKVEATVLRGGSERGGSETGLLIPNSHPVSPSPTPRVVLALSAGGAKGLAHIGVIQVLEENGIPIHAIAGSSMGAYVAAVWAAGHGGAAMERFAREVEGRWGFVRLLDPFLVPRSGFLRGDKTRRRLQGAIGDVTFAELPRPLRVVATNLRTLERVVFSDCRLEELDLYGSKLTDVVFERCSLREATISGVQAERVELRGCDLTALRGAEALRGMRIPWNDVLQNAPLFAAVAGIDIVD